MRLFKGATASLLLLALCACGGGGGGTNSPGTGNPGTGNPGTGNPGNPPGDTTTISGTIMLGPLRDAEVRVRSASGQLGSTRTSNANGEFVIEIPAGHQGPILIEALPTSASRFRCDSARGCLRGPGDVVAFGEFIHFDRPVRLYLSAPTETQVTLSPFSHAAAARAEAHGGLGSAAAIQSANEAMQALLERLLAAFGTQATLTTPYYHQRITDLTVPPIGEAAPDDTATLLALLGSVFVSYPVNPPANFDVGTWYDRFALVFADTGTLPLTASDVDTLTLETFAWELLLQMARLRNNPPGNVAALLPNWLLMFWQQQLLGWMGLQPALVTTPDGAPEALVSFPLAVVDAERDYTREVSLVDRDAASLSAADFEALIKPGIAEQSAPLDAATVVISDGGAGVLTVAVDVHGAVLAGLEPGRYELIAVVGAKDGSYREFLIRIALEVNINTLWVSPAPPSNVFVRDVALLQAWPSRAVDTIAWTQTMGPPVTIHAADQLEASFTAPDVDADTWLQFSVTVTAEFDAVAEVTQGFWVLPYPKLSEVVFADGALAACVNDRASTAGWVDVGHVTALDCAGYAIGSLSGIGQLVNLQTLALSATGDGDFEPLTALSRLVALDLTAMSPVACTQVEIVQNALPALVIALDGACVRAVPLALGGAGVDLTADEAGTTVYVSVPSRREIVAISTATFRPVRRFALPGAPHGLNLSADGTRLYAALHDANQIATIDLATGGYTTLALGAEPASDRTLSAIESEPGRLLVSVEQGHLVQVRANDEALVSRIGGSGQTPFVVDSDGRFAYVLAGGHLRKLDLSEAGAPEVDLSPWIGGIGSGRLAIDALGSRVVLPGGTIIATDSMLDVGSVKGDQVATDPLGGRLVTARVQGPHVIVDVYRFEDAARERSLTLGCSNAVFHRTLGGLRVLGGGRIALIEGDMLCLIGAFEPEAIDETARFAMADPALDQCVRDHVLANGWTHENHVDGLDCSAHPDIQSIDDIVHFRMLRALELAGTGDIDLRALGEIAGFRTLILRDTGIANLEPMPRGIKRDLVDVRGSHAVPCHQLDALRLRGTLVHDDGCKVLPRLALPADGHAMVHDAEAGLLYVSVPEQRVVLAIDAAALEVVTSYLLPADPLGLALAASGGSLYVGLRGSGDIAVLDLASGAFVRVPIAPDAPAKDVDSLLELAPGQIVAVLGPHCCSEARIYELRLDSGNAVTRLLADVPQSSPRLRAYRPDAHLYVFDYFLRKLNASAPGFPTLANEWTRYQNITDLAPSAGGSEIYVSLGKRIETTGLTTTGNFGHTGTLALIDDATIAVMGRDTETIVLVDRTTMRPVRTLATACPTENVLEPQAMIAGEGGKVFVLVEDGVCSASR